MFSSNVFSSSKNSVTELLGTLESDPTTLENVLKYAEKLPRPLGNVLISDVHDHALLFLFNQATLEKKSVKTNFNLNEDAEHVVVEYFEYKLDEEFRMVELTEATQSNRDTIEGVLVQNQVGILNAFLNEPPKVLLAKFFKKPNVVETHIYFDISFGNMTVHEICNKTVLEQISNMVSLDVVKTFHVPCVRGHILYHESASMTLTFVFVEYKKSLVVEFKVNEKPTEAARFVVTKACFECK